MTTRIDRLPFSPSLEPYTQVLQQQGTASTVARKDTIEAASHSEKSRYVPSKPSLCPELRMIQACDRLHNTGERLLGLQVDQLEQEQRDIDALARANIKAMQEAAERSQDTGVWSYLQKIGSGILSAISIFLGITLATSTTAVFIGAALIGSGIMTLANLALTEAGFWNWIAEKIAQDNEALKKNIRDLTPMIIGLLANGVQFLSLGALSIFGTLDLTTKALMIAQTAANVATTVAAVGGQISEARVAWSEAALTELQGKIAISRHQVDHHTHNIEQILARRELTFQSAKEMLKLAIEAKRQTLQV